MLSWSPPSHCGFNGDKRRVLGGFLFCFLLPECVHLFHVSPWFLCLFSLAKSYHAFGDAVLLCSWICVFCVFDPAHVFIMDLLLLMLPTRKLLGVGLTSNSACWHGTYVCLDILFHFVFTFVSWTVLVSPEQTHCLFLVTGHLWNMMRRKGCGAFLPPLRSTNMCLDVPQHFRVTQ